MNWKLTAGILGGYLLLSWLRKRGAITVNKDDAAGAVVSQIADQGDKIAEVAGQVKVAVADKVGGAAPTPGIAPPAGGSSEPSIEELGTIF